MGEIKIRWERIWAKLEDFLDDNWVDFAEERKEIERLVEKEIKLQLAKTKKKRVKSKT